MWTGRALALSQSITESDTRRDQRARIGPPNAAVTDEDAAQHLHGVQHRLRRRVGRHPPARRGAGWMLRPGTRFGSCSGWWMGWTSATIARDRLSTAQAADPAGEKRLRIISIVLVALGLISTRRMFAAGKRPPGSTPGA